MDIYDFAISYAGEDKAIAKDIISHIQSSYKDFTVFFAPNEQYQLVGRDGESIFEELFSTSKQVIVLLSESYKKKKWPRYEWDVILKRHEENRFIPIRLDDVQILGLPSSIICIMYHDNGLEVADICIKKLLEYERDNDVKRMSEFEKIKYNIKNSKGSVDKTYHLVKSKRKRTPLADLVKPVSKYKPSYQIIEREWLNRSVVKRLVVRIMLPKKLSKLEVKFNLDHCIATEFNKEKPDVLGIFAYCNDQNYDEDSQIPNVARADFAPYGDWGRAEEGVAYDLPVESFETKIEYYEEYWNTKLPKRTADSITRDIFTEILKNREH
jgi:hypothetical protein